MTGSKLVSSTGRPKPPNAGKGRPKGVPNKTTASVKEALTKAFDELGGVPALVSWAQQKPSDFYGLWGKLIPAEVKAQVTGEDGGPVEIIVSYVTRDKG